MREIVVINFDADKLKPYAFNSATLMSCGRQSKAFDRSVVRAPNVLPLSTESFHFSIMARRQCSALIPWQNPHRNLEKRFPK